MIDLSKLKASLNKDGTVHLIPMQYEELVNNGGYVLEKLGNKGVVMFTEKTAMIYFDAVPLLRLKVSRKKYFSRKDFEFLGKGYEIIGKGPDEVPNSFKMFLEDLKNNFLKILVILVLFLAVVNPCSYNIEVIQSINEKMIDIIGIFIGMVFVFIGFFYGDKERTVEVYKKGLCYQEFATDRYVINLAILEIVVLCFSFLFSNLSSADFPAFVMEVDGIREIINYKTKYGIYCSLIGVAIIILVIEFDALVNYYLKTMRNKYFRDAFESKIRER